MQRLYKPGAYATLCKGPLRHRGEELRRAFGLGQTLLTICYYYNTTTTNHNYSYHYCHSSYSYYYHYYVVVVVVSCELNGS